MPASPASSHTSTFEIKSANWPLLALVLRTAELHTLQRDWEQRFAGQNDFFDHDALLIDLSALQDQATPDFTSLLKLLRSKRLHPVACKGSTQTQRAAAEKAGLVWAEEALTMQRLMQNAQSEPHDAVPAAAVAVPSVSALVVERPLRSGQQVYARGRDLVVTAMVNPGAEVVADGNIHIYAPLRGKAIAGARGEVGARIFALCLEAELVSIAGVYRTSELSYPDAVRGKAVQIRLESNAQGDHLLIEPFA